MPIREGQPDSCKARVIAAGLTLLELLVALGVVGILVALIASALFAANARGRKAIQIVDLRSAVQVFSAWSNDHDGQFLNAGEPGDDLAVYLDSPTGELVRIPYLQQNAAGVWKRVLEATSGESTPLATTASYAFPCFTDPRLWTTTPQPWEQFPAERFLRPVRVTETQHPSEKGVLITHIGEPNPDDPSRHRFGVAFVDGSAAEFPAAAFLPQTEGFFGGRPARYPQPVLHTIGGIGGRDVAR